MEIKLKANDFVALYSQTLKRKVIGKVTDDKVRPPYSLTQDADNLKVTVYSLPEHMPGKAHFAVSLQRGGSPTTRSSSSSGRTTCLRSGATA